MTLNDWKSLSITQEIMLEWGRRKAEATEYLVHNAGLDPLQDRYYVGVLAAYNDMLDIELDEEAHN